MTQTVSPRPAGTGHRWFTDNCDKCGRRTKIRMVEKFTFGFFKLCAADARAMELLPLTRRFPENIG